MVKKPHPTSTHEFTPKEENCIKTAEHWTKNFADSIIKIISFIEIFIKTLANLKYDTQHFCDYKIITIILFIIFANRYQARESTQAKSSIFVWHMSIVGF